MWQKPWTWVVMLLLFIAAVVFTVHYFSKAYPIVSLDISMDRNEALAQALKLADKYHWGPSGRRQAASFELDLKAQHFVELEHGGAEGFGRLLSSGLYQPYTWLVRLYREGESNETLVRFTPNGRPYGFREKFPEDMPGAALPADSARGIAEQMAMTEWQVTLDTFNLVEASQEERPGGRIDHTFVYERKQETLGEGRYRLRLVVSGDRFSELTHFIKIPEAFTRKYQEMRSANNTLSTVALVAAIVFYIFGGCVIGLYFLIRQRWLVWRKPLMWGAFVALLQALVLLNRMPLLWMHYDTALSAQGFVLRQIVGIVGVFLGMTLVLALIFMTAESLTRRAFPNHLQLWKIWRSDVASSRPVLGRTLFAVWAVALFFAFDVGLYFFATRALGWWTPSEALFEPNVLATYFPWLTSIAVSLQAGFMEECMFRAIPIAGAALLGKRFGKQKLWILAAFIIQAFVFGAAHANYPQQPAYARLVELILPSFGFGAIYLFFGLLPGIISHFVVDVVWFSLPIFVSRAPGIWTDQLMVVLLAFVPLWVVLGAWIRRKKLVHSPGEDALNKSWTPPAPVAEEPADKMPVPAASGWGRRTRWVLGISGVLGFIVWVVTLKPHADSSSLHVTRSQAISIATDTLSQRGIQFETPWQTLARVNEPLGPDDRFLWQTAGDSVYHLMMGTFITPPRWQVRFVRFEGGVNERAEEYQVYIADGGRINRIRHILPEAQPGDTLDEAEARTLVYDYIRSRYNCDPQTLKPVSAEPFQLPLRRDWLFTFADTGVVHLETGEARLAVKLAGREIVDDYRFIHVPEAWERAERNRRNLLLIIQMVCAGVMFLIVLGGIVLAIVNWTHQRFAVSTFGIFFAILFISGLIDYVNRLPAIIATFSTAEPYSNQLFVHIALPLIGLIFMSATPALLLGFLQTAVPVRKQKGELLTGLSVGFFITGLMAIMAVLFKPSLIPEWAVFDALDGYIPLLSSLVRPINGFVMKTAIAMLIIAMLHHLTRQWTRRRALFAALFVLCFVFAAGVSVPSTGYWMLSGILSGVVMLGLYLFVFRFQVALLPVALAVLSGLHLLRQGLYRAYPYALTGALLGAMIIVGLAIWWKNQFVHE